MKRISIFVAAVLFSLAAYGQDPRSGSWPEDAVMFEVIGQVKNPSPTTSTQYGYLSYINGLGTDQTFAPGAVQNETTAFFTFYNEARTLRVVNHGSLRIVIREGTSTIYYHDVPHGDLTTPNPDSFRDGFAVMTSTWRHQVILEPSSTHFFVTFSHTITSSNAIMIGADIVRLGKPGDQYLFSLVGGPDPAALVDGKFAGTAVAVGGRK